VVNGLCICEAGAKVTIRLKNVMNMREVKAYSGILKVTLKKTATEDIGQSSLDLSTITTQNLIPNTFGST
jgi:hypothetical protein